MEDDQLAACLEIWSITSQAKEGRGDAVDKRSHKRSIAKEFKQLPDRARFPDYYDVIPEPMSLEVIKRKLDSNSFATPAAFFHDLHLIFLNAKHYNDETSQLYKDAVALEGMIHRLYGLKVEEGVIPGPAPTPPPVAAPPARRRSGRPPKGSVTPTRQITPARGSNYPPNTNITLAEAAMYQSASSPPTSVRSAAEEDMVSHSADAATVDEHERIRLTLDSTLERWTGPSLHLPPPQNGPDPANTIPGSGWWGDDWDQVNPNWAAVALGLIDKLKGYKNKHNEQPMAVFLQIPEASQMPYLSYNHPLSLRIVEDRLKRGTFVSPQLFDLEMSRLFEKARRNFTTATQQYGHVLELQRLYQRLTSYAEAPLHVNPPPPSETYYASLSAGPGRAKLMPSESSSHFEDPHAFASTRVQSKDRVVTKEARYKGMSYKLGDFVHVMNPDDPSRPIVGQIFRTFIPKRTVGKDNHHVTICWYFRPEQIYHTIDRLFYEDEIFKTGNFVDHPVDDVIERVGCQFFPKYTRGRPRAPEWYPGWPLWISNSRYNEKDRASIKIKNWAACIPEELRKSNFMTTVPFDKAPHALRLHPSPFKQGVVPGSRGVSGGIGGALGSYKGAVDGEDEDAISERRLQMPTTMTMAGSAAPPPVKRPVGRPPKNRQVQVEDSRDGRRMGSGTPFGGSYEGSPMPAPNAGTPYGGHQLPAAGAYGYAPPDYPMTMSGGGGGPNGAGGPSSMQFNPYASQGGRGQPLPPGFIPPAPGHQPMFNPNLPPPTGPPAGFSPRMPGGGGAPLPPGMPMHPTHHQQGIPSGVGPSSSSSSSLPPALAPQPLAEFARIYGNEDQLRRMCEVEELPAASVSLFERDPRTDKILWFSAPPIDVAIPEQPTFSASYLAHVLREAEREQEEREREEEPAAAAEAPAAAAATNAQEAPQAVSPTTTNTSRAGRGGGASTSGKRKRGGGAGGAAAGRKRGRAAAAAAVAQPEGEHEHESETLDSSAAAAAAAPLADLWQDVSPAVKELLMVNDGQRCDRA